MTFCLDSFSNEEINQILSKDLAIPILVDSVFPFAYFTIQDHKMAFFFWWSSVDFLPY